MTELQQNRYDKLLRRVGGLIGAKSMVSDALGELFPTIDVENVPGELLMLSGTRIAMATSQLGVLAANRNLHQLFNPADSQVLLVVTKLLLRSNVAELMRLAITNAALTTATGNEVLRDTRLGVAALAVGQNRTVQQAGGVAAHMEFQVEANITLKLEDENSLFVLFPGTGVTLASTSLGVSTTAGWWWRERVFEGAEAQFSG